MTSVFIRKKGTDGAALRNLGFMLWVCEEIEIRMGMHIDEPWREIVTARIDDSGTMRRTNRPRGRDLGDDARLDEDVGHKGRVCGIGSDDSRREEEDRRDRRCAVG